MKCSHSRPTPLKLATWRVEQCFEGYLCWRPWWLILLLRPGPGDHSVSRVLDAPGLLGDKEAEDGSNQDSHPSLCALRR